MSKLDKFKRKDKNSDNVWSSISDLMSGLMIVFLFTSVIFMSKVIDENTNIKKQQQTVENIVITYEDSKENIYEDLYNEFEGDMDNWHMEIDKDGTIRFKEPEVFFDIFPRYINVIYTNYKDKVTEIRIEGHTSSEWEEGVDTKTAYFKNMELSQDRTRNVLEYVMNMESLSEYENWLIDNITANGMSYSHRIYKDNVEDKDASRRVEFRVITNSEETINEIIDNYKK